jgi:hypothetical protein
MNNDEAYSVAVDASGNGCMAGYFGSPTITFGATTLTNAGQYDIFLAKIGAVTGIHELKKSSDISVFPDPATDKITIETPAKGRLSILNASGQELMIRQISEGNSVIDISNLPRGVYFVRLTNDKTVEVGKFIKQ